MHAKPDLRVVLKWKIAGSGSVIADVIQLGQFDMRLTKIAYPLVAAACLSAMIACNQRASEFTDSRSDLTGQQAQSDEAKSTFEVFGGIGSDSFDAYSNSEVQHFEFAAKTVNERVKAGELDKPIALVQLFDELGIDPDRLPRQLPIHRIGSATTWTTYQINSKYEIEIVERFNGGVCLSYSCAIRKTAKK